MSTDQSAADPQAIALHERAIHAAVIEMSLFTGNLEMKVRKAIARYEYVLSILKGTNDEQ